jgi:phage shock protein C
VRSLVRSREDRVLAGVCGGLGRYLAVDPLVVRLITVAFILSGVGVLAYIIAWIVIPEAPSASESAAPTYDQRTTVIVIGGAMIAIGALFVVRQTVPWFEHSAFWPLMIVAAGVAVLITGHR